MLIMYRGDGSELKRPRCAVVSMGDPGNGTGPECTGLEIGAPCESRRGDGLISCTSVILKFAMRLAWLLEVSSFFVGTSKAVALILVSRSGTI